MNEYQPATLNQLQEIVQTTRQLLPRGGGSKPALSTAVPPTTLLDMTALAGILEYEPGEYTFTAYAGTAVAHIQHELAANGQYLPFDPLLAAAGATLGGTVAANSCGSGRQRYGGVRDFILGVRFVDGYGRLIRAGGKVVKNAAGFDLPKFMVGSLGRYGVLAELSFKVFPQPTAYTTLQISYNRLETAMHALFKVATRPFDLEALDLWPQNGGHWQLFLRLGGLAEGLPDRRRRLLAFLQAETETDAVETVADDTDFWQHANALEWANKAATLVKVPLAPRQLPQLDTAVAAIASQRCYTAGGNAAWLAVGDSEALHASLTQLGLAGLALWGGHGRVYFGRRQGISLANRVKQALDPHSKFVDDFP